MRRAWLLAVVVLVAGCTGQDPAPPPEEEAGGQPPEADNGTSGREGSDTNDTDAGANGTDEGDEPAMQLRSAAFTDAEPIPEEHTADGQDTSPPLTIADAPGNTTTFALIVDDPDAPGEEPFVHWLIWNIPPGAETIAEGYPPSGDGEAFNETRQGTNGFGNLSYNGPAPPESDGPHRYRFQLFALDRGLTVDEGAQRAELEAAMEDHVIEQATLTGTYER